MSPKDITAYKTACLIIYIFLQTTKIKATLLVLWHIDWCGRGGGVVIAHKQSLNARQVDGPDYRSFEHMTSKFVSGTMSLNLTVIYQQSPVYKENIPAEQQVTTSPFFDEYPHFLESILLTKGLVIICGVYNFHINNTSNAQAQQFQTVLDSFDLKKHINSPTHRKGHTLDLVLTRSSESL